MICDGDTDLLEGWHGDEVPGGVEADAAVGELRPVLDALLLISGVWAWAIMSIKTARPATIKEQTVKVSQFLRACKEQTVILWTSAIGNFNIIRRQRACKEQKTIQGISAISNLYRYVDMLEHCSCLSCAELCVCV